MPLVDFQMLAAKEQTPAATESLQRSTTSAFHPPKGTASGPASYMIKWMTEIIASRTPHNPAWLSSFRIPHRSDGNELRFSSIGSRADHAVSVRVFTTP